MNATTPIPLMPGHLGGQPVQLVDARLLHEFLGVGRDFSSWIKRRIQEYGFEENTDYVVARHRVLVSTFDSPDWANQTEGFRQNGGKPFDEHNEENSAFDSPNRGNQKNRGGDQRSIDYFLTLDMAKELAMVERTARGREARRYFIECERRLNQMRQGLAAVPAVPAKLTRAERRAINRQAWAESAGQIHAAFHARREALIREYAEAQEDTRDRLPPWVQKERPS